MSALADLILEAYYATGKYGAEALQEAADGLTVTDVINALGKDTSVEEVADVAAHRAMVGVE